MTPTDMPMPVLAPDARSAEHRPGCPQKGVTRHKNRAGDKWATCRSCSASWAEPEPEQRPRPVAAVALAPVAPVTGYVCREHTDRPVNARGHGCPICDRARQHKPKPTIDQESRR